jgi:acyl-CoA synthetase (NDP forming)
MQRLLEVVPAAGSIAGNPLDSWRAYDDAAHFTEVLEMGYADPKVSMIVADRVIPRVSLHMSDAPDPTPAIIEFMRTRGQRKPTVFTVDFSGGDPDLAAQGSSLMARFCKAGIPTFPSLERAAKALVRLHRYHRSRG